MKTLHKTLTCLVAVAGAAVVASPAQAQSVNANVNATITVARPLTLTVVRPLQFGAVIAGNGYRTIAPNLAGTAADNGILGVNTAYPVNSAIVRATGEAGAVVTIDITRPTQLVKGGDAIGVTITDSLPVTPELNDPGGGAAGTLDFYLGGQANITANQAQGIYSGVIAVTAHYN